MPDAEYMALALRCARRAADAGEVPVGAVLVGAAGEVLAEAGNSPIGRNDPTAHAELLVLRAAARRLGNYRLPGTTLYATLEPCAMCAGALLHARVARLVFAAPDPRAGACGSILDLTRNPALNHQVEVCGGVGGEESAALLKTFFAGRR